MKKTTTTEMHWRHNLVSCRRRKKTFCERFVIASLITLIGFMGFIGMQQLSVSIKKTTVKSLSISPSKVLVTVFTDFPVVNEMTLPKAIPKFTNEESRHIGFSFRALNYPKFAETRGKKVIYLATQYFGEWNPRHYYFLHLGQKTFKRYSCPMSDCYATNDPKNIPIADAVLFHVRDLIIYKFPKFRSQKQVYILYSMEPPWLELLDFKRLNGIFNWTMSYRNGSDISIKYGFIGRRLNDSFGLQASVLSRISFETKQDKAIWYSSNCCTDSARELYINELRQHFPVDVLGGCGNEGCRPAEANICYKRLTKKYKFYLSFENAICNSYVTEKLYNILEYKIIPVVFGGVNYSSLTPPNSIINALDFQGPKELARYLWLVANNYSIYNSYFEWKKTFRAYLQPWMCDLCEKLNAVSINLSVRNDLEQWWSDGDSCKRWNGESFVKSRLDVLPCYHTRIFQ